MSKTLKIILSVITVFALTLMADDSHLKVDTVIDIEQIKDSFKYKTNDAKVEPVKGKTGRLRITMGTSKRWPTVIFHKTGKSRTPGTNALWDLSGHNQIGFNVHNLEDSPIRVYLRVDSPPMTFGKLKPSITSSIVVPAHKTRELSIQLSRGRENSPKLIGMQVLPQGMEKDGINPEKISAILVFVDRGEETKTIEIGNIKARGEYLKKSWETISTKEFFPFIDKYGQFKHDHWLGRVISESDLMTQKKHEIAQLDKSQKSASWNQYGGWKVGPKLKATGHFRVEKIKNKWWLIDPDGALFWSHGVDVIKLGDNQTVITERKHYFEYLPDGSDELYAYRAELKPNSISSGYFQGKENLDSYNFAAANLHRKYGKGWKDIYPGIVHKRLKHWGINTMGLWSDPSWTSMQRTPYVEWMYYWSPKIIGETQRWKRMVDMWHPEFNKSLQNATNQLDRLKNDPWLIGVFVDNELAWQDAISFTNEVLSSAPEQPAKIKFINYLKSEYKNIKTLNQQWNTDYSSWQVMIESKRMVSNSKSFRANAKGFFQLSAEHYYKTIRYIIKHKAPDMLYLGSRFAGIRTSIPMMAAAKYTDIISVNYYSDEMKGFTLPNNIDKPVIIGEWHFGAPDRGVFGLGLRHAENQKDRAEKYKKYAIEALNHPLITGIHWFQYQDQITTGRMLDGENHQIGFVSIIDSPYTEITQASREIGDLLYSHRYY